MAKMPVNVSAISRAFRRSRAAPATLALLLLWAAVFYAAHAEARERTLYFGIESFSWREFTDGTRAVKESGPRFGAGMRWQQVYPSLHTWTSSAEVFGGMVNYDGEACNLSGSCVPAASDVDYIGVRAKTEWGHSFGLTPVIFMEPFGGLGIDIWRRDVNSGTAEGGVATAGYIEDWATIHGRLGLRSRFALTEKTSVIAEGGVKIPAYNRNTAYLSDIGFGNDITVEPGRKNSFFAETGLTFSRITITFFYDSLRFSQSDIDYAVNPAGGRTGFRQPRSETHVYGIRAGWRF